MNRRHFLQQAAAGTAGIWAGARLAPADSEEAVVAQGSRVNILFVIADDWSWPHAGIYGASQISTPNFDRVAREGFLCTQAFTAAPQCSPNRAAILTGRHIWQLEEAGTHASVFPKHHTVYPDSLETAGYHVGFTGKGWDPGDWETTGWPRNPAGTEYSKRKLKPPQPGINNVDYAGNFSDFLEARPEGAPFCFWLGAKEPHRSYKKGAGIAAGKDPAQVEVPPFLPDTPEVRSDLVDYIMEVEWFDQQLGAALDVLDKKGETENTMVVVTSDNGMPFPRAKATVYEYGTHVPLAMRWPGKIAPGKTLDTLVSFVDFAPTFLEVAGVAVPPAMTGRSMLPILTGAVDAAELGTAFVQTGRERHTHARFDNLGYPSRTLRTQEYLYIRNFKPDRWPMGDPPGYEDIDDSPTLQYMQEHEADHPKLWELAVGKRPEEELYDIRVDAACMNNLAGMAEQSETLAQLRTTLEGALSSQKDPRVLGTGDIFESYPRVSAMRPDLGGFAERGVYNPKYAQ